jgi:hypothetical protein
MPGPEQVIIEQSAAWDARMPPNDRFQPSLLDPAAAL